VNFADNFTPLGKNIKVSEFFPLHLHKYWIFREKERQKSVDLSSPFLYNSNRINWLAFLSFSINP